MFHCGGSVQLFDWAMSQDTPPSSNGVHEPRRFSLQWWSFTGPGPQTRFTMVAEFNRSGTPDTFHHGSRI